MGSEGSTAMFSSIKPWRPTGGLTVAVALTLLLVFALAGCAAAAATQPPKKATNSVDNKPLKLPPGAYPLASLANPAPIPALATAVQQVQTAAPIPTGFTPDLTDLANHAEMVDYGPNRCWPVFGPGKTSPICQLGVKKSKRVLVVVGDSHAQMWVPALMSIAQQLDINVIPLVKPGCLAFDLTRNTKRWPCETWYKWMLNKDHALHPLATVVDYAMSYSPPPHVGKTILEVRGVLNRVTNGVLIGDPPAYAAGNAPLTCLSNPASTMANCTGDEQPWFPSMLLRLAEMAAVNDHYAIPTLQGFCTQGICPMVIGGFVTRRDTGHLTPQYSVAMGPTLAAELAPVLSDLAKQEAATATKKPPPKKRKSH
jgi:hypothetical protein